MPSRVNIIFINNDTKACNYNFVTITNIDL